MIDSLTPPATHSELPPGWRIVRFGDVVRNVDEHERHPLERGIDRYVGLEHIDPESLHINRWGNIVDGTSFTRKFVKGQVLFGKRRAYQRKVAVAEFVGICSGDILVFEPKGAHLLTGLLPFIVQSEGFFQHALGTSAGSLSPRTRWRDLAEYQFALPPLDEQRRIAEILWAIDGSIIATNEAYQSVLKYQRAIFIHIINNGLYSYQRKPSKYFNEIPVDWIEADLASISEKITDGEHITPPRQDDGVYLLSARNVMNGYLDLSQVDFISEETHKKICKRIKPEEEDILLSCSGTIGRVCRVPRGIDFSLVRSVAIIKPDRNKILPIYLEYCLRSVFLKKQIFRGTSQLAQGNLFQGAIRSLITTVASSNHEIKER